LPWKDTQFDADKFEIGIIHYRLPKEEVGPKSSYKANAIPRFANGLGSLHVPSICFDRRYPSQERGSWATSHMRSSGSGSDLVYLTPRVPGCQSCLVQGMCGGRRGSLVDADAPPRRVSRVLHSPGGKPPLT